MTVHGYKQTSSEILDELADFYGHNEDERQERRKGPGEEICEYMNIQFHQFC